MKWEVLARLWPLVVLLLLMLRKKNARAGTDDRSVRQAPGPQRAGRDEAPRFKRGYEPIEPK